MSSIVDEEWSSLTIQLANDPENFQHWESLLNYVSKDLTKLSPLPQIERFRITFDQFLLKYPQAEKYWSIYAGLEFKLGNTDVAKLIYEKGLSFISYSLLLWTDFLKFLRVIELDYGKLVYFYQQAEFKIGFHYHSYEFWNDYLDFEEKYNGKSIYYYGILRKVIELPIYNFAHFFQIWLNEIENINIKNFNKIVNESDLTNKLKIDLDKQDLKKLDYHELGLKLKKIFTDLYITVQYRSFELYNFEKNLKLEYFIPDFFKSFEELTNWDKYLDYVEINGTEKQIIQLYERSLIPLSKYNNIWLKYANYYIGESRVLDAKNILNRSLIYVDSSRAIPIYIKLSEIEISLNNYIKAKDLLTTVLINFPNQLIILFKIIDLEYLINHKNLGFFKQWVIKLILNKPIELSIHLLIHLSNFKSLTIDNKLLDSINNDERFNKISKFWIFYLDIQLRSNNSRSELIKTYNLALENLGDDDELLQKWYDDYLSYDTEDGIKKYFNINRKLVLK
ncbi:Pre-mRNA-processing factor 39 [Wickerhamomyces ciferrii]|uniref:Pre-mRNA-processing factor 39 n=1 Tax=Wickerhamomyces ciferrii (strain ATCC 14091 / BCRC 22168 / CBS 111 / JCM 3599 / NBRC 0793 / NRRL Y-1031 F-60-10) TaxID=1206466 RepID=K0KXB8_WICCF|nr:Pre-mRNA-processing factor 39 [Wickerhamomyces ciferrii]CCH46682.1 Pre-mRNA-processing factor 39 [Wickerhamomyces ciferrii]